MEDDEKIYINDTKETISERLKRYFVFLLLIGVWLVLSLFSYVLLNGGITYEEHYCSQLKEHNKSFVDTTYFGGKYQDNTFFDKYGFIGDNQKGCGVVERTFNSKDNEITYKISILDVDYSQKPSSYDQIQLIFKSLILGLLIGLVLLMMSS